MTTATPKRAYLVLGSESSGTRYLTRLLIDAGCAGSADHAQPWDASPDDYDQLAIPVGDGAPERLVLRRSFPHGVQGQWCALPTIVGTLEAHDYLVEALVTVRDWEITARSLRRAGFVRTLDEGTARVAHAYARILAGLLPMGLPFTLVTYHSLRRPQYRRWLRDRLQLPGDFVTAHADGDRRYHGLELVH